MSETNLHNYDIMSYDNWSLLRSNFRKVDSKDSFRKYDEPGYFFWKPLFYFFNGDDIDSGLGSSGLLHPSWITKESYEVISDDSLNSSKALIENEKISRDVTLNNSAYNYLMRNNEQRRAALLKDFITLLSDISSKTPWYFKEISGLDEAVARKSFYESPKIEDTRKQITITCLVDSIDTRIGNMLDMYRAACFSWQTKREIVPANLRKFDMGIYIYLQPNQKNIHGKLTNVYHKYLEFHNCEIDIDSCKFGDSFSVEESRTIEYKIVISYDNCYDNRYSNNVLGLIGDAIVTDIIVNDNTSHDIDGLNFKDNNKHIDYQGDSEGLGKYGEMYNSALVDQGLLGGFIGNLIGNALDATIGNIKQAVKSGIGGLLLGNLYTGSLKQSAIDIYQGRIISGAAKLIKNSTDKDTYELAGKNFANGIMQAKDNLQSIVDLGKMYEENKIESSINDLGSLYKEPNINKEKINKIGSLNKAKSIKNNI